MKHPVVGVVLVRDGHALLVHRNDAGTPPRGTCLGGHVEPGEHPEATRVRELRDELAITADVTGPPIARTDTDDFVMTSGPSAPGPVNRPTCNRKNITRSPDSPPNSCTAWP